MNRAAESGVYREDIVFLMVKTRHLIEDQDEYIIK